MPLDHSRYGMKYEWRNQRNPYRLKTKMCISLFLELFRRGFC